MIQRLPDTQVTLTHTIILDHTFWVKVIASGVSECLCISLVQWKCKSRPLFVRYSEVPV